MILRAWQSDSTRVKMIYECEIGRRSTETGQRGSVIQYTRPLSQNLQSQNTHNAVVRDVSEGVEEEIRESWT